MCYYNGQKVTRAEYIRLKNLEKLVSNYDFLDADLLVGFDYANKAVLKRVEGREDFDMVKMEWGFIPQYLKTRSDVFQMRNGYKDARSNFKGPIITLNAVGGEILKPGKIYRDAALNRRCLILSTGFYEWRHINRINKKTGKPNKTAEKYPYYISLIDKDYFFMAGLWQPWTDKETGEYVESCAIVTTQANELMQQVHNTKKRMPTILNEDLAWDWLFGSLDEKDILGIASFQYKSEEMRAYSVAKDFRNSIEPCKEVYYRDLPPLRDNDESRELVLQSSLF